VYWWQNKYAEAEANHKRALAILESKLGKDHTGVANSLVSLAIVYESQDRVGEAEAHYKRALAIQEKRLGKDYLDVALTLHNLGGLYEEIGRYADAEAHLKRAVAIREGRLGKDHPDVAYSLGGLANVYKEQGRYADAEAQEKRSLAIRENKLGKDHPLVAQTLGALGLIYGDQGRYLEAEAYHKRALAIREERLGKEHLDVARSLNNLAIVQDRQGKYPEAEANYKRAVAVREQKLGKGHGDVVQTLDNLADVYVRERKYPEAEALLKRALALSPQQAMTLYSLGMVYWEQKNYANAEANYKRALARWEAYRGKEHPDVAKTLNDLASVSVAQGKYADALIYSRKAAGATIAHAQKEWTGARSGAEGLIEQRADRFRHHVEILYAVGQQRIEPEASLAGEGFEIAQWAVQSSAATALVQMATRQAKGESELAQVVRERQDSERQWQQANQRLECRGSLRLRSSCARWRSTSAHRKLAFICARMRARPRSNELCSPITAWFISRLTGLSPAKSRAWRNHRLRSLCRSSRATWTTAFSPPARWRSSSSTRTG